MHFAHKPSFLISASFLLYLNKESNSVLTLSFAKSSNKNYKSSHNYKLDNFNISISHTTRQPRPNEIHDKDYKSKSEEELNEKSDEVTEDSAEEKKEDKSDEVEFEDI